MLKMVSDAKTFPSLKEVFAKWLITNVTFFKKKRAMDCECPTPWRKMAGVKVRMEPEAGSGRHESERPRRSLVGLEGKKATFCRRLFGSVAWDLVGWIRGNE